MEASPSQPSVSIVPGSPGQLVPLLCVLPASSPAETGRPIGAGQVRGSCRQAPWAPPARASCVLREPFSLGPPALEVTKEVKVKEGEEGRKEKSGTTVVSRHWIGHYQRVHVLHKCHHVEIDEDRDE